MKRFLHFALMIVLAASVTGCGDMHDQQSIQPQEAPRRTAPAAALSLRAGQTVSWQGRYVNPTTADGPSLQRGEDLYLVNCALCHGTREVYLGAVGRKLDPPPPSLHDARIGNLNDSDLFKRISLGFGRMPAFQKQVAEMDRWHLVNYVKTFR